MLKIKIHKKLITGEFSELDEGRKEDVLKSFPDKGGIIDYFTSGDKVIENNKYLGWMVKYADESNKEDIHSAVREYNSILKKGNADDPKLKSIDTFKSLEKLQGFITDYNKSIRDLEREGAKVVYPNDGRWEIIRPLNVQASCHRGRDARWCIAATKTKNYYKPYTKSGSIFYTIIDYSKKAHAPDSMYTYVFVKELPDTHQGSRYMDSHIAQAQTIGIVEVFDAEDRQLTRGDMKTTLGEELESKFFSAMESDLGIGELSSQLENHNHFIARLHKMINAFESGAGSEKYSIVEEVLEFVEEWYDEYSGKTKIFGDKKRALRNIYSALDKLQDVENYKLKKKIVNALSGTYLEGRDEAKIPNLKLYLDKLKINPNWQQDVEEEYKILADDAFYYSDNSYVVNAKLKDFVELAAPNNAHKEIKSLFDKYIKYNKIDIKHSYTFDKPPADQEDQETKRGMITAYLEYLTKFEYSKAPDLLREYFNELVDDDEYKINDILSFLINIPTTQNKKSRTFYKNSIVEHAFNLVEMSQNKKEYTRMCDKVLFYTDIEPYMFDKAVLGASKDELKQAFINPVLIDAGEEALTRVADYGLERIKQERSGDVSTAFEVSRIIRNLLRAKNITKKIAKDYCFIIATTNITELKRNMTPTLMNLIETNMNRVLGKEMYDVIQQIRDDIKKYPYVARSLGIGESKLFNFNKDYKVFKQT